MNFDEIIKIIPPPSKPEYCGTESGWEEVSMNIGFLFPTDYKRFISVYGTGALCGFLFVLNPFLLINGYCYSDHIKEILKSYTILKKESRILKHFIFNGTDGLYPWFTSDNGDVGYWLISSNSSSNWPIVVYDSRHSQYENYGFSCSEFLFKWIKRQLGSQFIQPPLSNTFTKLSDR